MASLKEKIGYGFGDMSSSMFWKIFSYYLPIFYADIFGLSLGATGMLMLVTRIWDTVSDPMMGAIADRTNTRWGKYRPYLLWIAAPFAIAGCLLFTTPSWGESGKLIWAYATYILMMTVYTGINVPYGSMLGVMTDDSEEKTVFSSYRMFFAYAGSFIALGCWEPLVNMLSGKGADKILNAQVGWQHAMFVIASLCFCMFIICFLMTREHIKSAPSASIWKDLGSLVRNKPWWLLTAAALCTNLFNTLRGSTAAFYFKYLIGEQANIDLGFTAFFFFAGVFLSIGEVCNMIGVACAVPFSNIMGGKKPAFIRQGIQRFKLSNRNTVHRGNMIERIAVLHGVDIVFTGRRSLGGSTGRLHLCCSSAFLSGGSTVRRNAAYRTGTFCTVGGKRNGKPLPHLYDGILRNTVRFTNLPHRHTVFPADGIQGFILCDNMSHGCLRRGGTKHLQHKGQQEYACFFCGIEHT